MSVNYREYNTVHNPNFVYRGETYIDFHKLNSVELPESNFSDIIRWTDEPTNLFLASNNNCGLTNKALDTYNKWFIGIEDEHDIQRGAIMNAYKILNQYYINTCESLVLKMIKILPHIYILNNVLYQTNIVAFILKNDKKVAIPLFSKVKYSQNELSEDESKYYYCE